MDTIRLVGLRARGHHGVLAAEKRDGQDFVVDVALGLDLRAAGRADDLALTVNYADLAGRISADVADGSLDLIEAVAERIAATALAYGLVEAVEVTVHKPHAPIPSAHGRVSVTIRRTREDLS